MTTWDGKERRNGSREDHDLLTRIDVNLTNFMNKFDKHVIEDKEGFMEHDKRIKNLEKVFWCGVGVLFVLEIVIKVMR